MSRGHRARSRRPRSRSRKRPDFVARLRTLSPSQRVEVLRARFCADVIAGAMTELGIDLSTDRLDVKGIRFTAGVCKVAFIVKGMVNAHQWQEVLVEAEFGVDGNAEYDAVSGMTGTGPPAGFDITFTDDGDDDELDEETMVWNVRPAPTRSAIVFATPVRRAWRRMTCYCQPAPWAPSSAAAAAHGSSPTPAFVILGTVACDSTTAESSRWLR